MYANTKRMEDIYRQHKPVNNMTTSSKKASHLSPLWMFIRAKLGRRAINKLISFEKSLSIFSTVRKIRERDLSIKK